VHAVENIGTTEFKAVMFELKKPGYTAAPAGKDPVVAGPKNYRKLEENERVRVLEVTFKPGQKIGAHAHPDHVAYVLEGGKLKITAGKAKPMEMELAAGQAVFLPAQVHSAQNTGKTQVRAIVVELKPAA
jgi:quercetin dioxygenase-like cupin family protein